MTDRVGHRHSRARPARLDSLKTLRTCRSEHAARRVCFRAILGGRDANEVAPPGSRRAADQNGRTSFPTPPTAPRIGAADGAPNHSDQYRLAHPLRALVQAAGEVGGHTLAAGRPATKRHGMHDLLHDASPYGLQRLRSWLMRLGHRNPLPPQLFRAGDQCQRPPAKECCNVRGKRKKGAAETSALSPPAASRSDRLRALLEPGIPQCAVLVPARAARRWIRRRKPAREMVAATPITASVLDAAARLEVERRYSAGSWTKTQKSGSASSREDHADAERRVGAAMAHPRKRSSGYPKG
jgi:hypothetical protein